jgi:hypothetical protein
MSIRRAPPSRSRPAAWSRLRLATGAALALAACGETDSATDLNPAGPPMVRQVFVKEVPDPRADPRGREALQLAFGDHPDIPLPEEDAAFGDDRVVDNAVARGGGAVLRVVVDELLLGNRLEEIECSDGSYSRVPDDADPDDIADCSGPDLSRCQAVCVDHGGIKDADQDGAVDYDNGYGFRMIDYGDGELGASVVCDGEPQPLIAEGSDRSYYFPSGNQLIPANAANAGDPDAAPSGLGPALVLVPSLGLRSGATCTVAFHAEVVDKDGKRVCAPPGGDVERDCPASGDTGEIQFQVEPLLFQPGRSTPSEGDTVSATGLALSLVFSAAIDTDTFDAVSLSAGGADVPIEVSYAVIGGGETDPTNLIVQATGGFQPGTDYTLAIGAGLTDVLGGAIAETVELHFSTEPAAAAVGR